MPDETRLSPLFFKRAKICSRTVRATFTAYGSPGNHNKFSDCIIFLHCLRKVSNDGPL